MRVFFLSPCPSSLAPHLTMTDYDICIIGSGAGGGPVAYELSKAGYKVLVLEKGPWFSEQDFYKDELGCCRRSTYIPHLQDEFHVIEDSNELGEWVGESTTESGWDWWNGNCVGGSSNFMSGFFHRMKPLDFKLLSTFGPIKGANIVDWPIAYDDLEAYYAKVESVVGVSGRVVQHPQLEPRSTQDFPYPPTQENPIAQHIDATCKQMGLHAFPVPRAILSQAKDKRRSCEYSGYCGSYGCSSGAKGSSRAALLNDAVASGNCEVRPHAKVYKITSDSKGRISAVDYYDANDNVQRVDAKIYVVACQAVETSRLLLASSGAKHPHGLGNRNGQVGRNLIFSSGGSGQGDLPFHKFEKLVAQGMKAPGPFVNRAVQDWYVIDDKNFGAKTKGGTIEFLYKHPNPVSIANAQKWDDNGKLIWGAALKRKIKSVFTEARYLRVEIFDDWTPVDDCFVTLANNEKDKWGNAVARVRIGIHEHDMKVARYMAARSEEILKRMGAENAYANASASPPANLMAGGCRFGNDPATSVLDADCRSHEIDNLFVTDGSFMPTGGSVPFTWTIYANSFRVADRIIAQLGGIKTEKTLAANERG